MVIFLLASSLSVSVCDDACSVQINALRGKQQLFSLELLKLNRCCRLVTLSLLWL